MVFPYYGKLSRSQQAIYRASDGVETIRLPGAWSMRPLADELGEALEAADRRCVERAAGRLCAALLADLGVPPAKVKVLASRPSRDWGELHGLYEADEDGAARITLWMRTAHHKRVVRFRTFVRTLLHEVCHHLDYTLLGLADSFHTEGFFKRESSLYRQILQDAPELDG